MLFGKRFDYLFDFDELCIALSRVAYGELALQHRVLSLKDSKGSINRMSEKGKTKTYSA